MMKTNKLFAKRALILIILLLACIGFVMTTTSTFDKAARATWVSALGIKPHVEFYASPNGTNYWDHDFPRNAPYSAAEAEAERGVSITMLGDNYQYQSNRGYFRKRCLLANDRFNLDALENGTHFFSVDNNKQLIPITLPETFSLKQYVKVIKEMGKIIKVEHVSLEWRSQSQSEYWDDGEHIRYKTIQRFDKQDQPIDKMVIEYNQEGLEVNRITYDGKNNKREMMVYDKGDLKEGYIYDADGYKTNYIIYGPIDVEENRSYDREGNVIKVSKESTPEFLPIDLFAEPDCSDSL